METQEPVTAKVNRVRKKVLTACLCAAAAAGAVCFFAFGPVGRYAFAAKYCETSPEAAIQALDGVPDWYLDTKELREYISGIEAYQSGDREAAAEIFGELNGYGNSSWFMGLINYETAVELRENGKYEEALDLFEKCAYGDWKEQLLLTRYQMAESEESAGEYEEAAEIFESLGDYADCAYRKNECLMGMAEKLSGIGSHGEAAEIADDVLGSDDTGDFDSAAVKIYLSYAGALEEEGDWAGAGTQLEKCLGLSEDEDSETVEERIEYCESMTVYEAAVELMEEDRYAEAIAEFDKIPGFLDADELNAECEGNAYEWEFDGFLSKDGTEETATKTFSRKDTIYFYGTLSGGKPGKNVTLIFIWTDCMGHTASCTVSDWENGTSGGVTFSYSDPENASTGKGNIAVYIEETGEQVAKYTVTVNK